jgi:hypothetical protein
MITFVYPVVTTKSPVALSTVPETNDPETPLHPAGVASIAPVGLLGRPAGYMQTVRFPAAKPTGVGIKQLPSALEGQTTRPETVTVAAATKPTSVVTNAVACTTHPPLELPHASGPSAVERSKDCEDADEGTRMRKDGDADDVRTQAASLVVVEFAHTTTGESAIFKFFCIKKNVSRAFLILEKKKKEK